MLYKSIKAEKYSSKMSINIKSTDHIRGWFASTPLVEILTKISIWQTKQGINGNIGEIGVHHGRMALVIFQLLEEGEKGIAIDLFKNQEENQGSGSGNEEFFRYYSKNILGEGWEKRVDVLCANSEALIPEDLVPRCEGRKYSKFRIFSVDGGHSCKTTVNDLELTISNMSKDGVIILDDYHHFNLIGVLQGGKIFMRRHPDWVPFYCSPLIEGANKLMLCHQKRQKDYLKIIPPGSLLNRFDPNDMKSVLERPIGQEEAFKNGKPAYNEKSWATHLQENLEKNSE